MSWAESVRHTEGVVAVVLAAGFSRLEEDFEGLGGHLRGIPKALLPVAGKPMLDHWWEHISQNRAISEVFVVSNAVKYKHFERWATSRGIPMSHVVNTGATSRSHSRGIVSDVELGLKRAQNLLGDISHRDVMLLAGDTLFFQDFDLDRMLNFRTLKGGSLMLYYGRRDEDNPCDRGMCQVDRGSSRVLDFAEKPLVGQRGSDFQFVSPFFYILEPKVWQQISSFNAEASGQMSFGIFLEHAIGHLQMPFWGMRMPGAFFLIGAYAGREEYQQLEALFANDARDEPHICVKAFARIGLMGNPSDGFCGKTISVTVENFWASVELWCSDRLQLLPHPLYDPSDFSSLADLHFVGRREGYYGGARLLMATCKRFQELCTSLGIALQRKNFTAKYDTNIPRQVGLAGSSAIVVALFRALLQFYDLSTEHIPVEIQPSFVLSVEQELGIQAGLQDRVVQVYGGLVYMDFEAEHLQKHGYGVYEKMPSEVFAWMKTLPLFIAYDSDPSDSGKIHSDVRARWDANEKEVVEAMSHFADLAQRARDAITQFDQDQFADLMDENFDTRRRIYGDACLGQRNLRMIEIIRKKGVAAKFPGSGGAVLGLCRQSEDQSSLLAGIRMDLESQGFVFCPIDICE